VGKLSVKSLFLVGEGIVVLPGNLGQGLTPRVRSAPA